MLLFPDVFYMCYVCEKIKRDNQYFSGKNMWSVFDFCCGHGSVYCCPECYVKPDKNISCSECGCEATYT